MVADQHPLKQGLKLGGRLEDPGRPQIVADQHPLKQGLKLSRIIDIIERKKWSRNK